MMLSDAQKIRDGYLFGLGIAHVMAEVDVEEKKMLLSKARDKEIDISWAQSELDEAILTLRVVGIIMERAGKGLTPYRES
jgi:hypothetical protein